MEKLIRYNMEEESSEFRATGLFLSGFQSIQQGTYIPIRPLTLLYGPNSAGKSSVLDAIGLLQNLAKQEVDLFYRKVDRWARRDFDERGQRLHSATERLRVGVEFTIPRNWRDLVSREVLEFIKGDYIDQQHIDWIQSLVGSKIQLDVGIHDYVNPLTYRLAINESPVFECRLGEQDECGSTFWDSNGRNPHDDDYDEGSEIAVDGPLRIYHNHEFWNKNETVASLSNFVKSNSEPEIAQFVRGNSNYTDLYDVMQPYYTGESNRGPFHFTVGHEFYKALQRNSRHLDRNRSKLQKEVIDNGLLTDGKSRRKVFKGRLWNHNALDDMLESLGAMCLGLLELGSKSLTNVQVSGSRQILKPEEMTFHANSSFLLANEDEPQKFPSFLSFARRLAYGETRSKSLHYFSNAPVEDYRLINQWLLATLPSLRGHKLSVDAFITTPVPRKRKAIADVPKFTYRLYLTDAQGRAHEFEDVGSGFSYLLPILMVLWNEPWSIIEQPELHLHPAAQCDVADVFIAAKNIGHSAVIESHSENLLLRLLRRVRETNEGTLKDKSLKVRPDDVAIMYFDPQSDGTTVVKRLRISRDGDFIDRWPAGFFEERTKELFGE